MTCCSIVENNMQSKLLDRHSKQSDQPHKQMFNDSEIFQQVIKLLDSRAGLLFFMSRSESTLGCAAQ